MVKSINNGDKLSTTEETYCFSFKNSDTDENFLNSFVIEYVVGDPHTEIIAMRTSSDVIEILVAQSKDTRDILVFKLFDDDENSNNSVSLWDVMEALEIKLDHWLCIVALKQCVYNIMYAIETERGSLFKLKESDDDRHMDIEIKDLENEERKSSFEVLDYKKLEQKKENACDVKNDEKVTKKLQKIETLEKIIKKVPVNETVLAGSSSDSSTKVAYYLSPSGTPKFTFYLTDYKSLEEGQWINDLIIDWYLTYLYEKVFSEDFRQRTYIYSSLFFAIMRNDVSNETGSFRGLDKKYSRVKRFVKDDVNIFEKDFVIMPVNENNRHWYLMIICYPGLVKTDQVSNASGSFEKLNVSNKHEYIKQPSIFILDSLTTSRKYDDLNKIRGYLSFEYSRKFKKDLFFSNEVMECFYPEVPMQDNSSDCGMFVLQYVESFFKDPKKIYEMPVRSLKNWFTPLSVIKKRAYLARKLQKMHLDTIGKTESLVLPDLRFPSLKKKMI